LEPCWRTQTTSARVSRGRGHERMQRRLRTVVAGREVRGEPRHQTEVLELTEVTGAGRRSFELAELGANEKG
jgi:hypothetical protein